jgi:biopolymer transport protein ExbD
MRRLLGSLLLAALGACTQQHVNGAEAARTTYVLISFQPPDRCSITVGGKTFNPMTDEAAVAAMKREFAIHPDAHLVADLNVPYKCVGGAIIEAQRAGFKKIGFISEPPLRKGEQ